MFKVMDIMSFKSRHSSEKIDKDIKELRRFGFSFGLAMSILGTIMFYRESSHFILFVSASCASLSLAIIAPALLRVFKKTIDALIKALGWAVNVLTMILAFYLIFTPIAVLFRIFGRDLLNQKIDKDIDSYWIKRKQNVFTNARYERMG